jgi:hypothetical protein
MQKMTPKQAARFGYLAGQGASLDAIRADPMFEGRSGQSFANASKRWRIAVGTNGHPKGDELAVHITERDREILESAARCSGAEC